MPINEVKTGPKKVTKKSAKKSSTQRNGQNQLVPKAHNINSIPRPPIESELQLFKASETGNLDLLYKSLWSQVNVNCKNPVFGTQPLSIAIKSGNTNIAKVLIRFGASINSTDNYGVTPVHWAAVYGRDELLGVLLNALIQQENAAPSNPRLKALASISSAGSESNKLLNLVKRLDPNELTNMLDKFKLMPTGLDGKIQEIHPEDKLVETSAVTAGSDALKSAEALHHSDVGLTTIYDLPMQLQSQYAPAIQVLATKDKAGNTPLHFASAVNLVNTCVTLLQHGSNPTLVNNAGCKPSDLTSDSSLKLFLKDQESLANERQKFRYSAKTVDADAQKEATSSIHDVSSAVKKSSKIANGAPSGTSATPKPVAVAASKGKNIVLDAVRTKGKDSVTRGTAGNYKTASKTSMNKLSLGAVQHPSKGSSNTSLSETRASTSAIRPKTTYLSIDKNSEMKPESRPQTGAIN